MPKKEIVKKIYEVFGNGCLSNDIHKCEYDGDCAKHERIKINEIIEEYAKQVRADAIEECANKFAEILSNMTQICGNNCPIKCNWGTEYTCKDMCKKWFVEQLKGAEK